MISKRSRVRIALEVFGSIALVFTGVYLLYAFVVWDVNRTEVLSLTSGVALLTSLLGMSLMLVGGIGILVHTQVSATASNAISPSYIAIALIGGALMTEDAVALLGLAILGAVACYAQRGKPPAGPESPT